jgi:magnesium chelatase family protein
MRKRGRGELWVPAELRKEGPAYDLPIVVGILVATHQVEAELGDALMVGELSLDRAMRHVNGILPLASMAALVEEVAVYPVRTLTEMAAHLKGDAPIERHQASVEFGDADDN